MPEATTPTSADAAAASSPNGAAAPTATLLWEVGCEELPAWACDAIEGQVETLLVEELQKARLLEGGKTTAPSVFVGPRRFAVELPVRTEAPAVREERRGPAVGAPDAARQGFARSLGLTVDQLKERDGLLWGTRELAAEQVADVFPAIADSVLSRISFAKPMRWGRSPYRFVRPIRWVVTMLDDRALEYDVWGVRSGAASRTHRFLGDARELAVASATGYAQRLADGFVVVDQRERRSRIEEGLAEAAARFGGEWYDPARVLREVVHLVEYPTVVTGRFDERYLALPERVLVTAMQSHQRYLPIRTDAGLAPAFLCVMNGDPAAVDSIRAGYERVLEGRLDDAVFSFERDRKRGLDDMATSLGAVVFHAKAGSLADRTHRIAAIAAEVARQLDVDAKDAADAARLAKADQVSVLVQEFAELEGFAGSLYARDAGYGDAVCTAIDQQFRPRSAEAPLPDVGVPAVIALADKVDLLVTMFAIGEQPTGSRDPHGLRRAAIGIMRIVIEHDLSLDIDTALRIAAEVIEQQGIATPGVDVLEQLRDFVDDRVEKRLTDGGVRVDAVRAARAAHLPRLQHVDGLARALAERVESGDGDFLAVLTASRRCVRILEKAGGVDGHVDATRFESPSERALHDRLAEASPAIRTAVHERDFAAAVRSAASLGPEVDAFFDRETGVMVMADDEAVRTNRLLLVRAVTDALTPLGDLTVLQV